MKRYMLPILFLFSGMPLVLLPALSAAASSAPVARAGTVLVESDVVTVGDLFESAGSHANHVLAPAPEPGKQLVLSPHDFTRIARAFRLSWTAPQRMAPVIVERDARLVTEQDIIHALSESALQKQISQTAQFTFDPPLGEIIVGGKADYTVSVHDSRFDSDNERFSATIRIARGTETLREISVTGLASPMVKVPVLRHAMMAGNTIRAADLTEIAVPQKQVTGDMILFTKELVGMTMKRSSQPNQILKRADIVPPVLVRRNELVTVTYRSGAIILSTKARALSAGARHDTITLLNVSSNKSFEATVTGPQQAEVNLDG